MNVGATTRGVFKAYAFFDVIVLVLSDSLGIDLNFGIGQVRSRS